jgi:hypothetical protein
VAEAADAPFVFNEIGLGAGALRLRGLVMMPKKPMIVDRERLDRLRGATTVNDAERGIIAAARRARARVLVLRAADDTGTRLWQLDPSLDEPALAEGGYVLSRAILPLHRRLVAAGVMLMVHTEWGVRECYAMRERVVRLAAERRSATDACGALDDWLLRHVLLHTALGFDHVVKNVLPSHVTMIDRRAARVTSLLAELPASELD